MSKRKLLLADDSVTIQKVVNLTFADEGIDVITVGDGNAAVQKISESAPDLVLADVHMPGLTGYQVCEAVRGNPATKDLPVVLLVGSFEPFDEAEAARVGANGYLTKPFQSIRQLVTQVSDLMEASAPAAATEETEAKPPVDQFENTDEIPEVRDGVPDTSDIDSLYAKSFGEPEPAETSDGPPRYVDAGMDDEMIETSHAGVPEEVASAPMPSYESESTFEYSSRKEEFYVETRSYDSVAPADEPTSEYEYPATTDYASQTANENSQPEFAKQTVDEADSGYSVGAFDTLAEEAGTTEAATEEPKTADTQEPYFDSFTKTEQIPVGETIQSAINEFALDDIELLDLPPLEGGKSVEFTTKQGSVEQGSNKQVVSVSPELMEIIVQRVVEKLSKDSD